MATYKYRITDKFGRDKKGTLEAGSPEAATAKLKGEGRDYKCRRCLLEHNDR